MKAIYQEKKNKFEKFQEGYYLLFLNETRENFTPKGAMQSEDKPPKVIKGYAYVGDEDRPDGGTLIEAKAATYDEFVSGLIRKEYSASRVEAILTNHAIALGNPELEKSAEYLADLDAFQTFREKCKAEAKSLLDK